MSEKDREYRVTQGIETRGPVWVKDEGFTVLSEPAAESAIADLVFVHGLQGHPWRTWRYKGKTSTALAVSKSESTDTKGIRKILPWKAWSKKEDISTVYWPADLLPLDEPNLRILTYGYDSHVTKWFGGAANQMNLSQHGTAFLNSLEAQRRGCHGRPLILVAHSLGGLVVKDALIKSRAAGGNWDHLRDIYQSLASVIFFGTPHRGSPGAGWGFLLKNIATAAGFGSNGALLRQLDPSQSAEHLESLNKTFVDIVKEKDARVTSFQESKGLSGSALFQGKVVPEKSSALYEPEYEAVDCLTANHMDMCRFRGPQDQGYVKARDAISLHVESVKKDLSSKGRDLNDTKTDRQSPAKEVVSSTHSESVTTLANASQQTLQRDLARSLYFGDIGARKNQIYTDSSEVNSWIWSNDHPGQNFPDWLSGPQNLYWIQGKAGSGKSTLVKYITQHENLERCLSEVDNGRSWKVVSFYFDFRARRGLANNFEGLLRSLLLQLIRQAPDLATEITPFGMDELDVDFCLRWNVAALRPALRATLSTKSNICIFVDGLDEYEGNYLDLVDFFKEVEEIGQSSRNPSIKLCLASRPEPLLLEHLRHCGSLKMQECNYESISVYVSKRLQDIVHSGPGPDAQGLINGVAERSEGVFLWATHVVDELLDAWSCGDTLEDLEQRLSDLPPDLEDMFARMLNRVKPAHVHEASIMLRLTCYAKDNLTLEQLLTSVMLAKGSPLSKDPKSDPRMAFEMQRRVAAYTRGLLESRTGEERMMEWISANVPVNARSSSFTDLQEDSNEKINPSALSDRSLGENILKSEVRLVHKSFRTYLERPGWLSTFLTNRAPELYHGEELWLRVCVAYLQLARNAMPQHVDDIDRSLSSQLLDHSASLHKYVYSHLETHAAAFEAQTKQSSYPLLHSFFSDNNFMNYFDLDDHLFKGQNSITSLSIAASRGLELYVREEVSLGEIDITARSGRALLAALQRKEESIIEYFLSSSVPVEDVHIIRALQNLPPRIVETLLKRRSKGDLWLKDETGEQVTPLYVLAHQNCKMYKPLVQFFINHGEGINAVSGPCGTALHASLVTSQSLEKVEFLISKGADVNADGPIGTPLEIARKWHFYKVDALPLLIRYGATSDRGTNENGKSASGMESASGTSSSSSSSSSSSFMAAI